MGLLAHIFPRIENTSGTWGMVTGQVVALIVRQNGISKENHIELLRTYKAYTCWGLKVPPFFHGDVPLMTFHSCSLRAIASIPATHARPHAPRGAPPLRPWAAICWSATHRRTAPCTRTTPSPSSRPFSCAPHWPTHHGAYPRSVRSNPPKLAQPISLEESRRRHVLVESHFFGFVQNPRTRFVTGATCISSPESHTILQ